MAGVEDVKRELEQIDDRFMGAYLYGSQAAGRSSPRSDVDVCVVAGPDEDAAEVLRTVWRSTRLNQPPYDVHAFEELPLYLKAEVLENGELLVSRDEPALSEYLRRWRKIWADQAHRNTTTEADVERIMAARRRAADARS